MHPYAHSHSRFDRSDRTRWLPTIHEETYPYFLDVRPDSDSDDDDDGRSSLSRLSISSSGLSALSYSSGCSSSSSSSARSFSSAATSFTTIPDAPPSFAALGDKATPPNEVGQQTSGAPRTAAVKGAGTPAAASTRRSFRRANRRRSGEWTGSYPTSHTPPAPAVSSNGSQHTRSISAPLQRKDDDPSPSPHRTRTFSSPLPSSRDRESGSPLLPPEPRGREREAGVGRVHPVHGIDVSGLVSYWSESSDEEGDEDVDVGDDKKADDGAGADDDDGDDEVFSAGFGSRLGIRREQAGRLNDPTVAEGFVLPTVTQSPVRLPPHAIAPHPFLTPTPSPADRPRSPFHAPAKTRPEPHREQGEDERDDSEDDAEDDEDSKTLREAVRDVCVCTVRGAVVYEIKVDEIGVGGKRRGTR